MSVREREGEREEPGCWAFFRAQHPNRSGQGVEGDRGEEGKREGGGERKERGGEMQKIVQWRKWRE